MYISLDLRVNLDVRLLIIHFFHGNLLPASEGSSKAGRALLPPPKPVFPIPEFDESNTTRPWIGAGADEVLLKGSSEPTTSETGPKLGLVIDDLRPAGAS